MTKSNIDELPTGVELRKLKNGSTSLRIIFYYKGVRCRETLNNLAATKANIKYAANLRGEILIAIGKDTFNYLNYFPNSPQARKLGFLNKKDIFIKDLLEQYQSRLDARTEHSTHRGYRYSIKNHLMPHLGHITIKELNAMHIRDMVEKMKTKDKKTGELKPQKIKTIRNHLIPLNDIIDEALSNKMLKENPMTNVIFGKFLPKECFKSNYVVSPFGQTEIKKILDSLNHPEQAPEKNMIQFWFFTGLRPSELRALEWQDINFDKNVIKIDRALVLKRLKEPKTEAGTRTLMILPPALDALIKQKQHSFGNNKRVFFNPSNGHTWRDDNQMWKWWKKVLRNAEVSYRNIYQCRHTYASTLLSKGENPLWVATQMGHVDTEMITKTYGKWIPDNTEHGGYKCQNDWGVFLN